MKKIMRQIKEIIYLEMCIAVLEECYRPIRIRNPIKRLYVKILSSIWTFINE